MFRTKNREECGKKVADESGKVIRQQSRGAHRETINDWSENIGLIDRDLQQPPQRNGVLSGAEQLNSHGGGQVSGIWFRGQLT